MSTTTTTTFNINHFVWSVVASGKVDAVTGESVPRVICSCGKSFTLSHVKVSAEEYIAQHAMYA